MKEILLPWISAKNFLHEGDVLLFKGKGVMSYFIKRAGEGKYSHVGLVSAHPSNGSDPLWECVEFSEWKGGRTINLERYVKQNSGLIDIYRPRDIYMNSFFNGKEIVDENITFQPKRITNFMRKLTGLPHGWKRIIWIAQHKLPFLRLLYPIESIIENDENNQLVYPVCSTAVSYAFSRTGYQLLHNRADKATEPSDISRSPLLSYLFTIK